VFLESHLQKDKSTASPSGIRSTVKLTFIDNHCFFLFTLSIESMLPVLDTQVQAGSSLKWQRFLGAQICEDHDVSYLMSGCSTWRWDIQQRKSSLEMFRTPYLMINTDIKRVKHSWRLCYLQPTGFMKQAIEIILACSRRYVIRFCQHRAIPTLGRWKWLCRQHTSLGVTGHFVASCSVQKPGADPSLIMVDPLF